MVEQDIIVRADAYQWGLDRVDQRNIPVDLEPPSFLGKYMFGIKPSNFIKSAQEVWNILKIM